MSEPSLNDWQRAAAKSAPGGDTAALNWVTPDAAPTLCVHGTEDKYVAYEQAGWLIDRLKACGVEAELLTLEGAGHGFKGADADKAQQALLDFFAKHLRPAEK